MFDSIYSLNRQRKPATSAPEQPYAKMSAAINAGRIENRMYNPPALLEEGECYIHNS